MDSARALANSFPVLNDMAGNWAISLFLEVRELYTRPLVRSVAVAVSKARSPPASQSQVVAWIALVKAYFYYCIAFSAVGCLGFVGALIGWVVCVGAGRTADLRGFARIVHCRWAPGLWVYAIYLIVQGSISSYKVVLPGYTSLFHADLGFQVWEEVQVILSVEDKIMKAWSAGHSFDQ